MRDCSRALQGKHTDQAQEDHSSRRPCPEAVDEGAVHDLRTSQQECLDGSAGARTFGSGSQLPFQSKFHGNAAVAAERHIDGEELRASNRADFQQAVCVAARHVEDYAELGSSVGLQKQEVEHQRHALPRESDVRQERQGDQQWPDQSQDMQILILFAVAADALADRGELGPLQI